MFLQAQESSDTSSTAVLEPLFEIKATAGPIAFDEGNVLFALYDSEESFRSRKPLQLKSTSARTGDVGIIFDNVPKGIYVITCLYDQNGNGMMDFDANGMPVEDYGWSNNVMSLGPPRFGDAKFEVSDKDLTFDIRF
jgi:uncharacterized protein (DUF2141 family)